MEWTGGFFEKIVRLETLSSHVSLSTRSFHVTNVSIIPLPRPTSASLYLLFFDQVRNPPDCLHRRSCSDSTTHDPDTLHDHKRVPRAAVSLPDLVWSFLLSQHCWGPF